MAEYEYRMLAQPHQLAGGVDDLTDDQFAMGLMSPIGPLVAKLGDALHDIEGGGWDVLSHDLHCLESKLVVSFLVRRKVPKSNSLKEARERAAIKKRHALIIKPVQLRPEEIVKLPNEDFAVQFVKATIAVTNKLPGVVPQLYPKQGEVVSHCLTRIGNRLVMSVLLRGD